MDTPPPNDARPSDDPATELYAADAGKQGESCGRPTQKERAEPVEWEGNRLRSDLTKQWGTGDVPLSSLAMESYAANQGKAREKRQAALAK